MSSATLIAQLLNFAFILPIIVFILWLNIKAIKWLIKTIKG